MGKEDRPPPRAAAHAITRAFDAWYAAHGEQVPFALTRVEDKSGFQIFLDGVNSALSVYFRPDDMSVGVNWKDEHWDLLLSIDLSPVSRDGRWHCASCQPQGDRMEFDSLEALWADHFFEPLAEWLQTRLKPATFLVLHRIERGTTWVSIVRDGEAPEMGVGDVVLPVHVPKGAVQNHSR